MLAFSVLRYLGLAVAVVGLWCLLHGGLTLCGGFRWLVQQGAQPPSTRRLLVECLYGSVMFVVGVAVLIKFDGLRAFTRRL